MAEPKALDGAEDLQRGLSLLGPALKDIMHRLGELNSRLTNITAAVAKKSDAGDVPTLDQFRALCDRVAKKADHAEVARLSKNATGLAERLDIHDRQVEERLLRALAPTAEQFAALSEAVSNNMEAHGQALQAHASSVPTLEQFEALRRDVLERAERKEVPTVAQFEELGRAVSTKAESVAVPTLEQHRDLSMILASKADAHTVQMLDGLSTTFTEQLKELNDSVMSRIKMLGDTVSEAPTRAEVQQVLSTALRSKANVEEVPTLACVDAVSAAIGDKADIAWTQEQLKGITDILLPVARAVRGLQGTPLPTQAPEKLPAPP